MTRVLFVYQLPSPFILQDLEILRRHGEVHEFRWSSHPHPARALSRWMVRNRGRFDVAFVWFGDLHASVVTRAASVLRKPSVVVAGGYDVSDLAGYGFLSTRPGMRRAQRHFAKATRILAVSRAIQDQLVARFPDVAAKTEVVYLGVDQDRFRPNGPRRPEVLSVAGAEIWTRAWIKGWDRLAAAARLLPEVAFRIVGAEGDVARRLEPPPNLRVEGPVAHEALVPVYQKATVYVQASRFEALSSTIMEAMASGCVPVVVNVGGMPELVGDAGFVVAEDPAAIAEGIRKALVAAPLGPMARGRMVREFSLRRREEAIVRVVEELA